MLEEVTKILKARGLNVSQRNGFLCIEPRVMTASSDDHVFEVVAAAWDDFEAGNEYGAERLAKNHNFLVKLLIKIRDKIVANPKTWFKRITIFSAIMMAGSAIQMLIKNPQRFGVLSSATVRLMLIWIKTTLRFTQSAIVTGGTMVAKAARGTINILKAVRGPLLDLIARAAHGVGDLAGKVA